MVHYTYLVISAVHFCYISTLSRTTRSFFLTENKQSTLFYTQNSPPEPYPLFQFISGIFLMFRYSLNVMFLKLDNFLPILNIYSFLLLSLNVCH